MMRKTAMFAAAALLFAVPAYAYSPPDPGGHILVIDQGSKTVYLGNINVAFNNIGVIDQQLGHAPPLIGDSPGHVLVLNAQNGFDDVVIYSIRAGRDIASIDWGVAPKSSETIIDGGISGAGHGTLLQTWTASATAGGNLQIMEHADSALT